MRTRSRIAALISALVFATCVCLVTADGQAQDRHTLSKTVSAVELSAGGEVRLGLGGASISKADLADVKVTLESLPSGQPLYDKGVTLRLDDETPGQLIVRLGRPPALHIFDSRIRVSVTLPVAAAAQATGSDARREAINLNNQFLDSIQQIAKTRIAYAKTSREKHLYISGGFRGGEMAANHVFPVGNVWRLRRLISQIDLGMSLDKGSGDRSDPDFLNMGINFRKIFPLHRRAISNELEPLIKRAGGASRTLRSAMSPAEVSMTATNLVSGIQEAEGEAAKRGAFFRAIVFTPLAPRMETSLRGHHSGFLINFVNNSDVQVRTGARPIFGSKDWTWDMKLIPLALEAGVAVRNPDDPSRKGSPLVRLNTGAVGKLTYHFPCGVDVLLGRVELEMRGMNRHLFDDESAFNPLTQRADALVRGNKYAAQADFRFVFGYVTPIKYFRRHPALTVTYKNGFFPPLYAYNNAVSVHFTFESEDDDSVSDMALKIDEVQKLMTGTGVP